jgi:diaminohydroxyphosphoribosylaminopyrimidine deaminase/5-amino-6-(5-phosphoribosylamino)uracil reductase
VSVSAEDFRHMARALQLAARGLYTAHPNPRVGCVIVANGDVVGEGWHARTGGAHAEIAALEQAGPRARGGTAYVTLEPCCHKGRTPPCTEALLHAGITRVVSGARDPNPHVSGEGVRQLREAGIEVEGGVIEAESRALNVGFVSRMERGRPWIRSKLAVSLDGRTALANGASRWISSEAAREDAQAWRARSSAILTGAGTVLADDPLLTVRRLDLGEVLQPERIVLDSRLRVPPGARLLRQPGRTRILCNVDDAERRGVLQAAGAVVETLPAAGGQMDLTAVAARLAELEMNEVLVEAGPSLNGALLAAGLLDELIVYLAPHVLGASARGMFEVGVLADMESRRELTLVETRRVGPDVRLIYRSGAA